MQLVGQPYWRLSHLAYRTPAAVLAQEVAILS